MRCASRLERLRSYSASISGASRRERMDWRRTSCRAHDFVILLASQLLIPYDESVHLGNLVNPTASHVVGQFSGNDSEGDLVLRLFDRIRPGGLNAPPATASPDQSPLRIDANPQEQTRRQLSCSFQTEHGTDSGTVHTRFPTELIG